MGPINVDLRVLEVLDDPLWTVEDDVEVVVPAGGKLGKLIVPVGAAVFAVAVAAGVVAVRVRVTP
jgi:hypothetical protein